MPTDSYCRGGSTSTAPTSMWQIAPSICVLWCRDRTVWSRVRRWAFSRPYANVLRDGAIIEMAFTIPVRKQGFVRRVLGLPIEKRRRTPRQRAHDARLRARAAAGGLSPRPTMHQRQYFTDEMARQEAQR